MTVVLVTGGNRGIGHAIVRSLCSRIPDATVVVGCRSREIAAESVEELRAQGLRVDGLALTITDDASIREAVSTVEGKYGRLDVLVNNAGAVPVPKSQELEELRSNWAEGLDCLLTSPMLVTKAFIPLLRKSGWGRVIMVSSARGSLTRNRALDMPPSQHWMYDCSKAALNLAMIEFRNSEVREIPQEKDRITFWAVSPGHCRTGFNGFRGTKDPLEGAEAVSRLLASRRAEIPSGTFWECEYGNFQQIPW
ncbi:uncharacterized protein JN550_000928 [Neoarthrinium moseri]|uniref:uncharacterized protein n=1 Tax=Neoarthrinium moseri TaxID=1658444 RepID=UPI001FDD9EEF|nr:uncharacterized protein JN550_000928 [Neoarthrinium moseri]KAI1876856.1 hypothetical protein JN550_000928 [Neoarthrinium moseri]